MIFQRGGGGGGGQYPLSSSLNPRINRVKYLKKKNIRSVCLLGQVQQIYLFYCIFIIIDDLILIIY